MRCMQSNHIQKKKPILVSCLSRGHRVGVNPQQPWRASRLLSRVPNGEDRPIRRYRGGKEPFPISICIMRLFWVFALFAVPVPDILLLRAVFLCDCARVPVHVHGYTFLACGSEFGQLL